MTPVAIGLNLLLASLLAAALVMGWMLNRRLKLLRDGHDGFAKAVAELDLAARRAEQGLAALRAATDEAETALADRIDAARALVARIDRAAIAAPPAAREDDELRLELDRRTESRLGSILSAARVARPARAQPEPASRRPLASPRPRFAEDDLFDEPADRVLGARR